VSVQAPSIHELPPPLNFPSAPLSPAFSLSLSVCLPLCLSLPRHLSPPINEPVSGLRASFPRS